MQIPFKKGSSRVKIGPVKGRPVFLVEKRSYSSGWQVKAPEKVKKALSTETLLLEITVIQEDDAYRIASAITQHFVRTGNFLDG